MTKNLTGVFDWPQKCMTIDEETFYGSAITEISGIEKVTSIKYHAFAQSALRNIKVGECLKSVSIFSFAEDTRRKKFSFGGDIDFSACTELTINTAGRYNNSADALEFFKKKAIFPSGLKIEDKNCPEEYCFFWFVRYP